MLRTHKHASFVLAAVIAVTLVAVCCLGAASSMPDAGGNANLPGPSLLAPHSAPFSASTSATSLRLHAMGAGGAAIAPTRLAATYTGAQLDVRPVLSSGHSIEPFCLRLRI